MQLLQLLRAHTWHSKVALSDKRKEVIHNELLKILRRKTVMTTREVHLFATHVYL